MNKKVFEVEEYRANDSRGRNAVRSHLDRSGRFSLFPTDVYGPDILSIRMYDSCIVDIFRHEVEVKKGWKDDWPESWRTVQVPARREYLATSPYPVILWVLRDDLQKAWCITGDQLQERFLGEVPNKKVPSGEMFYKIPIENCKIVEIGDNGSDFN